MAGSTKKNFLITASVLLPLATAIVAGVWFFQRDITFPPAGISSPPPAPPSQGGDPSVSASNPQGGSALPESSRTESLPRQSPSQTLPFANGSRVTPEPASPPDTAETSPHPGTALLEQEPAGPQEERGPDGSEGHQAGLAPDAKQAGSGDEPKQVEQMPPHATTGEESSPVPHQAAGPVGQPPVEQAPLIVYGKGSATDENHNVVRGEIPARQTPPDTTELYGAPSTPSRKEDGRRFSPKGEDSVVGLAVVQNLAKFLADNYWPAGTHPRARRRGITTATVKWANAKFGGQMPGFAVNHANIPQERIRVLNYLFMPSMITGLYDLYSERFLRILEQEALSQRRGAAQRPLSQSELAEMYALYGTMARGLAATVRAYADAPDMRALARAYAEADIRAEEANHRFLAAMQANVSGKAFLTKQYQAAILQREQRHETLVSALRRNGAAQTVDAEAQVYAALWLYRRGDGSKAAIRALADVLDRCADTLDQQRHRNKAGKSSPEPRTRQ